MTAVAIALFATLPFAAAAWLAGWLVDRTGASAQARARLWSLLLALPLMAAIAIPLLSAFLPKGAPFIPVVLPDLAGEPTVARAAAAVAPSLSWSALAGLVPAIVVGVVIAGALLRLGITLLAHYRLTGVVRRAEPADRPDLAGALPPLRISDEVPTPLLAGLLRPVILLPRALAPLPATLLTPVCRHEAAHLARRDNLRRLAEDLALAPVWFNPAMTAIRDRLAIAREELCDVAALADATPQVRRDYAETLVRTLRLGAGSEPATAFVGTGRSPNAMRLKAILTPRTTPSRGASFIALGVAALLTTGLGGGAVALAAQAGGQSSYELRQDGVIDGAVVITADSMETFEHGMVSWKGNVAIRFEPTDLSKPGGSIRLYIDGKPAPKGLRPDQIDPATIERVQSFPADPANGRPYMAMNVRTVADAKRVAAANAVDLKAFCGNGPDARDGLCAGMLIGASFKPDVCAPKDVERVNEMIDHGKRTMDAMEARPGQPARAFAIEVMQKAWPCPAKG